MITDFYRKNEWHNQRILSKTLLFGREYYWMRDTDGTHYLSKIDEAGNPDLS